jgi:hypothetical protein
MIKANNRVCITGCLHFQYHVFFFFCRRIIFLVLLDEASETNPFLCVFVYLGY